MEGLRKISSRRLNFSVAWGLPKLGYPSPKSSPARPAVLSGLESSSLIEATGRQWVA